MILSDDDIRERCQRHVGQPKPDDWLPMIEPFVPNQVKTEMVGPPGHEVINNVISYGTSSYGYDIRCGYDFKIFNNIHHTIVDPKHFDERAFVNHTGDYCIIPPNSFALAKSMEYMRIPRDILTICLGKSTMARCFTGDTEIALANGTTVTFKDMVTRYEAGEQFFGYGVDEYGNIVVVELIAPRKIGNEEIVAVHLDNDLVIRCTPDHQFLMRDGTYVEAQYLKEGSSVFPLYRTEHRGYETVYQPDSGKQISTHWLADDYNLRHGLYEEVEDSHRHHVDLNKRNNYPSNIQRMNSTAHLTFHNNLRKEDVAYKTRMSAIHKARHAELAKDPNWLAGFKEKCSRAAKIFFTDEKHAAARLRRVEKMKQFLNTPEEIAIRRERMRVIMLDPARKAKSSKALLNRWLDKEFVDKKRRQAAMLNVRSEITEDVVKDALDKAGSIRGAARMLNCDRTVFRRFASVVLAAKEKWDIAKLTSSNVMSALKDTGTIAGAAALLKVTKEAILSFTEEIKTALGAPVASNHKVTKVEKLNVKEDVYCLTSPETGNFALESGVFVKNCGIIVNVTPLEPEWEGEITLEFSNTTPLPAKIYAGEGVAQILFLRNPNGCSTSYKDRGGKYQGQRGITLPRA